MKRDQATRPQGLAGRPASPPSYSCGRQSSSTAAPLPLSCGSLRLFTYLRHSVESAFTHVADPARNRILRRASLPSYCLRQEPRRQEMRPLEWKYCPHTRSLQSETVVCVPVSPAVVLVVAVQFVVHEHGRTHVARCHQQHQAHLPIPTPLQSSTHHCSESRLMTDSAHFSLSRMSR